MPVKFKTPGGERTQYAVISLVIGLYVAIKWFLRGDVAAGTYGALFAVVGVGLWFNQQWARWAGISMVLFAVGFMGFKMAQRGFDLLGTTGMVMGLVGCWFMWKEFSPEKIAESDDKPKAMISLVLLLRKPRYLEAKILAQIVSSAWGQEFSSGGDAEEDSSRFVVGKPPMFVIQSPEAFFIAYTFPTPYFNDLDAVATELKEIRVAKAVKDHQAWLAVDLITIHDSAQPPESVYPQIAKLVAELAPPDALAIYEPETGKITPWDESLEAALRGPDSLSVFGKPVHPPVIHIDDDDPRMQAAVAEARSRWPEFVEAFNCRDGKSFSVKAPITSGDRTEFIWIEVSALSGDSIQGTLGNEPVDLNGFKLGDGVQVPVADLNDWVYIRNGEPTGLFTAKVFKQSH